MVLFKKKKQIKVPSKRRAMFVNVFTAFSFYWFLSSVATGIFLDKIPSYIEVAQSLNETDNRVITVLLFIIFMGLGIFINSKIYSSLEAKEKFPFLQGITIINCVLWLFGPTIFIIIKIAEFILFVLSNVCERFTFVPWIMGTILIIIIIIGLIWTKEDKV